MSKELITKKEENQKIKFDYSIVDKETEDIMRKSVEKIYTLKENIKKSLGEEFGKVQKQLAGKNQYNGFFEKWYTSMGFKRDFVYDCIHYCQVLIANSENKMIQELAFSKVCELSKIKDDNGLQKQVIEKAPLKEIKVKQVAELVKEVNKRKEVTDELIEEICNKADESNNNFKQFVKTTITFIEDLKEQKEELTDEKSKEVMKLVEEIKELCVKAGKNGGNE